MPEDSGQANVPVDTERVLQAAENAASEARALRIAVMASVTKSARKDVVLIIVGVVALVLFAFMFWNARETRATADALVDCTTSGHPCFDRQVAANSAKGAVEVILRGQLYIVSCQGELTAVPHGPKYDTALAACLEKRFAAEGK